MNNIQRANILIHIFSHLSTALSDRMSENDFLAYTTTFSLGKTSSSASNNTYPFIIEKKNGTISNQSLQLNAAPYDILKHMAAAIDYSSPPPPSEQLSSEKLSNTNNNQNDIDKLIQMYGAGGGGYMRKSPSSLNRNVLHFLKNMNYNDIKLRKLDRINATSAVLSVRRAFQFSAVDGTRLGWSSASLAVCLSSLVSLHEEHNSKIINSFYPFRLLLSADELGLEVDVFGGIIRLNPAATKLQWLRTLAAVSEESVCNLKNNQNELKRNLIEIEHALGCTVTKGHTCASKEYHQCLRRLALESIQSTNIRDEGKSELSISNEASIVIESGQVCKRGKMRKDGNFEVGANMNLHEIRMTIGEHARKANFLRQTESDNWARCKELIEMVMYNFGVAKVWKVSNAVATDKMADCLFRLTNKDDNEKKVLREYLAGNSIAIVGHGQLCHISDDGSIVLPTNFS